MKLQEVENTKPLWVVLPMSEHLPEAERVYVQIKPYSYKEHLKESAAATQEAIKRMQNGFEVDDDELTRTQVSESITSRVLAFRNLTLVVKDGTEKEILHGADLVEVIPKIRASLARTLVQELDKLVSAADPGDPSFLPECPLLRGSEQGAGQKSSTSDAKPASEG